MKLTVRVDTPPDPHLLRAAIEARLADRPWTPGAEQQVGDAVKEAVQPCRS